MFYIFRFDYDYMPTWHVVEAPTKADAIKKVLRGTKDIPESKVKFWKKKGSLPKTLAGRAMLPSGWVP